MNQKTLNRIKLLGGNIDNVKNVSLQADLESITFNTVLYPKSKDTPWLQAEDSEPIYGIGDFIEENKKLFEIDKDAFYTRITNHYYKITEEGFGQMFFKNKMFTPFKSGTNDFEEWNGEWDEDDFRKVIIGTEMELMFIGYSYGSPDTFFICLSDPNQENPTVYSTDHEVYFDEISKQENLEEFFNTFKTQNELLEIIKNKME